MLTFVREHNYQVDRLQNERSISSTSRQKQFSHYGGLCCAAYRVEHICRRSKKFLNMPPGRVRLGRNAHSTRHDFGLSAASRRQVQFAFSENCQSGRCRVRCLPFAKRQTRQRFKQAGFAWFARMLAGSTNWLGLLSRLSIHGAIQARGSLFQHPIPGSPGQLD